MKVAGEKDTERARASRRRRHLGMALVGIACVEVLYGCGEADLEEFIDENIAETSQAQIFVNSESGAVLSGNCDTNPANLTQFTISTSTVLQSGVDYYASGSWAVSGASGIHLDHYIDGFNWQTDLNAQVGTSGTWDIAKTGLTCGTHTYTVCAYPRILASTATCWGRGTCLAKTFTVSCVGVIPNTSCPPGVEEVWIFMDDEDGSNDNNSSVNGWVGATEGGYNTKLKFCKVPGSKFKPLSTANELKWHYSVLNLSTCPANSTGFKRTVDNQDSIPFNKNDNSNSGNIAPNTQDSHYTHLNFCLFQNAPSGAETMSSFPNLGFSYGVFASNTYFEPSLILNNNKGWAYSDDEKNNNDNSYTPPSDPYPGYPVDTYISATQIIGDGHDGTRFNMVKVK